jgi:hypothetical protein
MPKLKMLCVYDEEEWVDTLRIYEVPCDGMMRYILHHIEDEDMHVFDSLRDALKAAGRRVALGKPHIDKCPS